jgi:GntR family transcriptional regulator / MocR family aminotransferase
MTQELLVSIDRKNGPPLHVQIERELRHAIRSGRLPSGTPLPSSRTLAQDLGISRGVIVEAYDQLIAEGYLIARRGSATRVAKTGAHLANDAAPEPVSSRPRYDFRLGVPNLAGFPRQDWLASVRRVLKETPDATFGYPDPRGVAELRAALAAYLGRVRGVTAEPNRVVICSGYAQGLLLVCQALKKRGARRVVMEDPFQGDQRAIVARAGLEPVNVPVDEHGLRTDVLAGVTADAAVVTPAHQYPTGAVLAPERRVELCSWAERQGAVVIEDDYDAEYRYDREPIGALQGLSPERVVYAGSTSKTLAPCLRLGWFVLPSWLVTSVAQAKFNDDLGSPGIEQLVLADFISSGRFDRHLRRNRAIYRRRRDALVSALREHVPEAEVEGIAAGLHLVATFPEGVDEKRLVDAAAEQSVGVMGMARYRFFGSVGPPAILLGYGNISKTAIEPGVRSLKQAIEAAHGRSTNQPPDGGTRWEGHVDS